MATGLQDDDFNEDDFDDFNPHPYQGGYDIAQTYGAPLPPSPAICYPLSQGQEPATPAAAAASPPDAGPQVEEELEPEPEPEPEPIAAPIPPVTVVDKPWFEPYAYSGDPYQPPPYKPDLFRSWPFSAPQHCCRHTTTQVRDFDYWNHMMRGLDFLFGHAQGYGERTVGTDVYGVPIYANKATPTPSLSVHVDPPPVHTLEYHHPTALQLHPDGLDTWPSWCEERKEEKNEKYGHSYRSDGYYNYEQSTSKWDVDSSYHDTYHDWRYNNFGYLSNVEGEFMEENELLSTPLHSYNQHYYEQPLHVQVERTDQTWTQEMISYENTYSSYCTKEGEVHQPNILNHGYERERYEQTQYEHLEPFKPSWSQNAGYYYENLEGETVRSDDYYTFCSDEGHASTAFTYNEENVCYEQNQSSWATRDSHVLYGEDVSYGNGGDPSNWTDAIFGSSQTYYAYDH